ncbi:RNA-directed DNA polymerase, eukaryota [Tanacetum coccineum]
MSMTVWINALFGRVKVFASLANLKMALGNEGFSDIVIKYMGEQWVIKATNEFEVDGRIAWVEVEGVPFKLWTNNTFTRIAEKWGKLLDVDDQDETCFHSKRLCVYLKAGNSIREDFKITHRGKMYWIRANETQGWVPEFTDEYESEDDNSMDEEGEVKKNGIKDEHSDGEIVPESLFEDGELENNHVDGCLKHPPGFTPLTHNCENDTSEEEVDQNVDIHRTLKCYIGEFLSDHRPILLKENGYDYGPTPFRFFHHWLEMDGFNTFVENTWKNSPMVGNNALLSLMNKLRNLKNQIRIWNKSNSGTRKNDQLRLKKQLEEIDLDIDRGLGNEELVNSRLAILHQIQKIDNLESKERAQKAKIKWAVEGDENSGFFHGIINKRRNIQNIRGVMVDGNWIENPNDVKKEFFDHFANRFGKPDKPTASISLDFPNQISHEQSDHMEREVSNDEIKKSVWECGTDKAPGPDGFTFGFFRHFWHLVDRDVCEAVRYFFKFSDLPKGCNSSFIALIPKIPDANLVKDFRPISLIGSIYKIIAKILTNRLVDVLGGIINEVQSAFIKDRQILDGPFILNEVMSWCKKKKKQTLLFKVDFEKAYDSVRWDFLDDVLGKFGFGDKWRKWIQCCLHSSKGSIIINGSPTDEFQFGRGLKQGDPLSPFLFLLIMESLHISFQRVVDAGMFHGIDVGGLVNLSHMFYADDAVFIGEWSESNITSLIHVLDCFHKVSGLKINMCKSKIMGIEVDNGKVSRAATKFGCLVLKAPFLYLGSYVGGDMNKIQSWKDIIDRIRRRLSRWKMKMLSIGGRLMLIKSVLGSMPIFHMSMFKVPAGVIQILESLRSKFFNGHESSGKKASWVQWKKALAPKDNGGLGIFSLYALNRGLIFKWVWRFLAHEPTLWSRVIKAIHGANGKIDEISGKGANSCWINIIKEVRRLEEKGINLLLFMKKKLGNGLSTLFWDDVWCDGGKLKNRFPRAYALENSKQITVGQKLAHPSLYHSFRRHPRGGLELTQVEELAKVINPVVLTQSPDSWSWTLNNSGGYTVASSRNMIDSRLLPKGDLKTRWIRYVPNKVNTFAWKVMTNSLPTRFNISRRGIDIESLSCVNCDVGIETNDHLFFACNTAKKISKLINRWWDVPFMDINSYGEWRSWIDNVKLPKKNKSMFQVLITGVGIDAILCLAGTIVLLELVTGSEANEGDGDINLAEWAWKHFCEGDSIMKDVLEILFVWVRLSHGM